MAGLETEQSKRKDAEVHRPEVLWGAELSLAETSHIPACYGIPQNPFKINFAYAKDHVGPDSLAIVSDDDEKKITWLTVHRKPNDAPVHRVEFERQGDTPVEMYGLTHDSSFVIYGPNGFHMRINCNPRSEVKAPTVGTKEPAVDEQPKRRLEEAEANLDQVLEQEKGFRKKRWMAIIKPLVETGKPIKLGVDEDNGVGLQMPGEQEWIELAHDDLYYYEAGFHGKDRILKQCGVKPAEDD